MVSFCLSRAILGVSIVTRSISFHGVSMPFTKIKNLCFIAAACLCLISLPAHAQSDEGVDILPAKSLSDDMYMEAGAPTHPPIRITPDKSELIRLDKEAGTVIVGNPAHLSILADSATTLILVPQVPGATHFTVLDRQSNIVMQRHVIVASPKEKYVRIRRSCAADSDNCMGTQVYYCPDMCHEIAIMTDTDAGGGSAGGGVTAEGTEELGALADSEMLEEEPN